MCMHVCFEDTLTHRFTVADHSPNPLPLSLSTHFLLRSQRASEKKVHTSYIYKYFAFFLIAIRLAYFFKKVGCACTG